MGWWSGTKNKYKQISTLTPEQQPLHEQLRNSIMNPGAGGAFGAAGDYYRDLLSNDPQAMERLSAPEIRRFNEETIPGIAEQFAGMGSGGLSSSGFQNAAVNAGQSLAENLGSIRENLRMQGAQGLFNLGQYGLQPIAENVMEEGQPGFGHHIAEGIGKIAPAVATAVGGPMAGLATGAASQFFNPTTNRNATAGKRNTPAYGRPRQQSPQQGFQLPNFNGGR